MIKQLYPLIQAEFFIGFESEELTSYLDKILHAMRELNIIELVGEQYQAVSENKQQLVIVAQHIQETLERYAIVLKIMNRKPNIERSALTQESHALAKRLSQIHGINAAEFFDKQVLTTFISSLKTQGYFSDDQALYSVESLVTTVTSLMRPTVLATIRASLN